MRMRLDLVIRAAIGTCTTHFIAAMAALEAADLEEDVLEAAAFASSRGFTNVP